MTMLAPEFQNMAVRYHRTSAAKKYLVGFVRHGKVYYVIVSFEKLMTMLQADRESTSHGGAKKLTVYVSTEQIVTFIMNGEAVELCDAAELTADKRHNKGDNFERIITEKLIGKTWKKDRTPYWQAGDINLNGEEIQVKLTKGTLVSASTLAKAETLAKG